MQYDLFNGEYYPDGAFRPLHELFRGVAQVEPNNILPDQTPYKVNLTTGECSCKHGAAYTWYVDKKHPNGLWITNRYCVHKLKAVADIIESNNATDQPDILFPFMKAVSTRYNQFEAVSAFHKYLRLGREERSYFFACILSTKRGVKGVIRYLLAIVYEETRDHSLRRYLSKLMERQGTLTFLDMAKAIKWFCEAKKKWHLHETRLKLFHHEMRGYQQLIAEFGENVAKAQEIIDSDMVPLFLKGIGTALKKKDYDKLQYCVKGLQKSKFPKGIKDLHQLRTLIYKTLAEHTDLISPVRQKRVAKFQTYLEGKSAKIGISYHDINAFADLFAGESLTYGNLSRERREAIMRIKKLPAFPFDTFPPIPSFAHDNHTYRGKGLLRNYAAQIPFGIMQSNVDLRGCGAYIGVAWRYMAQAQTDSIACEWHVVKSPVWLKNLTLKLFY